MSTTGMVILLVAAAAVLAASISFWKHVDRQIGDAVRADPVDRHFAQTPAAVAPEPVGTWDFNPHAYWAQLPDRTKGGDLA